ncbi:MAG TPA: GNAT family protein [Actinomycetota bacterium]
MSPLPIDLGDGVLLRRYTLDDADDVFALVDANRDRLGVWMPWADSTRTIDDERAWLASVLRDPDDLEGTALIVEGRYAGGVGLSRGPFGIWAELGYWIDREHEGRGLVTRACVALLGLAFDELGVHRVVIRAGVGNARSRAIPERLGFTQEGVLREEGRGVEGFHDLVVYGLLEDEWRART